MWRVDPAPGSSRQDVVLVPRGSRHNGGAERRSLGARGKPAGEPGEAQGAKSGGAPVGSAAFARRRTPFAAIRDRARLLTRGRRTATRPARLRGRLRLATMSNGRVSGLSPGL